MDINFQKSKVKTGKVKVTDYKRRGEHKRKIMEFQKAKERRKTEAICRKNNNENKEIKTIYYNKEE